MPFLNDSLFDAGLDWLRTNTTRLDICSQEPTTYTEATSTYTLGNVTGFTVGANGNGDVSGRKATIPAVSGASVTGTGTATHVAGSNGSNTMTVNNALASSQAVTSGNTFDLAAFDVELRDPT